LVHQPPVKNTDRASLDLELFACADREGAPSPSAHAILAGMVCKELWACLWVMRTTWRSTCASKLTFSEIA
jgi:hypothetical protein